MIIAAFAIYQYFHRYSAQPQALMEHLQAVSTQSAKLTKRDVDVESILVDVQSLVRSELVAQLSQTGFPDPEQGADALLVEAMAFTESANGLVKWVEVFIQDQAMPDDQTSLTDTDSARVKVIQAPEVCLQIARQDGSWRLTSLFGCEPDERV
ncbi:hypothetical protein [Reinekea blandensis]|uniref:Uncharacterized protein n=1 Tax=Reinekea blandensis MED297 TaxID=314283 RepID=A4B9E2_9GAMM|nr:hypothetical protein [Reinekea blandensis]EAR11243.1 hypothetical protein MED297_20187 [Reinekea sp. MED297] [Reinekea blandensis MED297]